MTIWKPSQQSVTRVNVWWKTVPQLSTSNSKASIQQLHTATGKPSGGGCQIATIHIRTACQTNVAVLQPNRMVMCHSANSTVTMPSHPTVDRRKTLCEKPTSELQHHLPYEYVITLLPAT